MYLLSSAINLNWVLLLGDNCPDVLLHGLLTVTDIPIVTVLACLEGSFESSIYLSNSTLIPLFLITVGQTVL